MWIKSKAIGLVGVLVWASAVQASFEPGAKAVRQNAEWLGLNRDRFVRGEVVEVKPSRSGVLCLTGWSHPKLDAGTIARQATETEFGTFRKVRKGDRVGFKTAGLRPGVYNVSLIDGSEIKAAKEIVIAYPDDYVFDLKDPLLHGIKNTWNDNPKAQEYDKHYSVVAVCSQIGWAELQPERDRFDFSKLDALLAWSAYTQKPAIFKFNAPAPEWIFDYVAHVGGKSPLDDQGRGGGTSRREKAKAPQFWSPAYKEFYKEMIQALAAHVAASPHRKWFLGLRVQPNAFNEEAWHYTFNGGEMQIAGISPDRGTWIPPRNGDPIYPPLLEADDYKEAKQYFTDVMGFYQEAFHPLGIYCFLRPYLEVDQGLNLDLSGYYANTYTVCMGTDATASRPKLISSRAQVYKKYTRDLKKGAFHEDTYASFNGDGWNAKHGKKMNYKVSPRLPEKEIYWRQFLKLYEGVTMSAWGGTELFRLNTPAYQAALDVFMKYAGGEMDPAKTEHAWMVFAGYCDWSGKKIKQRNVGYWLAEDDSSKTETVVDASDDHRAFMLGTIREKETTLSIAPEFRQAHKGQSATVSIEWLAEPGDAWELLADGKRVGGARGTQNGFQIDEFELRALPSRITVRKQRGNPKFHIVEVGLDG